MSSLLFGNSMSEEWQSIWTISESSQLADWVNADASALKHHSAAPVLSCTLPCVTPCSLLAQSGSDWCCPILLFSPVDNSSQHSDPSTQACLEAIGTPIPMGLPHWYHVSMKEESEGTQTSNRNHMKISWYDSKDIWVSLCWRQDARKPDVLHQLCPAFCHPASSSHQQPRWGALPSGGWRDKPVSLVEKEELQLWVPVFELFVKRWRHKPFYGVYIKYVALCPNISAGTQLAKNL